MNEQLTIGTPENVSFGYPIAGIGSRFIAALVDSALIVFLQAVVYLTLFLLLLAFAGADLEMQLERLVGLEGWLIAGFSLIAFAFLWGYYIFFEIMWNGQSPGKRLVKLRVIRSDGGAVTLTESIIRNLVRFIDFLPLGYGLGVAIMFINDQSRRFGDLAAGTLVVHDRLLVTLDSLRQRPLPNLSRQWEKLPELDLPFHRLSATDITLVQEFLQRETELLPRDQMAQQVVQFVYNKLELPPPNLGRGQAAGHLAAIVYQAAEMERP